MGRKTNATSAELERGWFRLDRRKANTSFALALGMDTITGLTIANNNDSTSAALTELSSTETTASASQPETYVPPTAPPSTELPEIVGRLGEYGLRVAPDPEDINFPDQIFVTDDGECAVQQGISDLPGQGIAVSAYLFGPIYAVQDRDLIDLDGTQRAHTAHAEGTLSIGQVFPRGKAGLDAAVAYLVDTTRQLCDGFVPPYMIGQPDE